MDINNKIILLLIAYLLLLITYTNYLLLIKGFMRAVTQEENYEVETLILNKVIKEIKKMISNFFFLVV